MWMLAHGPLGIVVALPVRSGMESENVYLEM